MVPLSWHKMVAMNLTAFLYHGKSWNYDISRRPEVPHLPTSVSISHLWSENRLPRYHGCLSLVQNIPSYPALMGNNGVCRWEANTIQSRIHVYTDSGGGGEALKMMSSAHWWVKYFVCIVMRAQIPLVSTVMETAWRSMTCSATSGRKGELPCGGWTYAHHNFHTVSLQEWYNGRWGQYHAPAAL